MSAILDTPSVLDVAVAPSRDGHGPAARAAARVSRAGLMLGAVGLGAVVFVLVRLVETWRVTPRSSAHEISLLGARLSYPQANAGALVVLGLAVLGLAVTMIAFVAAGREILGATRLRRRLTASSDDTLTGACVISDRFPRAFCAGLLRPRVYVTTGALARLDPPALQAVLRHEHEHARRHDPLRFAAGRVLSAALFFIPSLAKVLRRQHTLAELRADESAMAGGRSALARAMLAFSEPGPPDGPGGVDPERVDHLLGQGAGWGFPLLLCMVAGATIALLVAVAVLAGRVARGSATLAPPFLSSRPCVLVLATIPAALALLAGYLGYRRARA